MCGQKILHQFETILSCIAGLQTCDPDDAPHSGGCQEINFSGSKQSKMDYSEYVNAISGLAQTKYLEKNITQHRDNQN